MPKQKKKKTLKKSTPPPAQSRISALLREKRVFKPSPSFSRQANCSDPKIHERAARDPEKFWHDWALQLEWIKPPKKVLE
ncbi:MAG: acetyl-coenzyme A synthetase N-terminal domain-containing protein, partial [Thermodesulfobacteriota bacterium]